MNWKPCECIGIKLNDNMGRQRTRHELEEMIQRIDNITSEYGFDVLDYDSWKYVKNSVKKSVWAGTPLEEE